jgi:uncharacterized protein (DUF488 family)
MFTCRQENHKIARVMKEESAGEAIIYTVGHSNHATEKFLSLLAQHHIEVVVDVRSHPSSRFNPQYNSPQLSAALKEQGFRYIFLGKELGGRPSDERYYDEDGYVLYQEWAASPVFLEGVERLQKGLRQYRMALMCSEENPQNCHRRLLITPVLRERNIEVLHLRGDGSIQSEDEFLQQELQPSLFGSEGVRSKSVKPVAAKKQPDVDL